MTSSSKSPNRAHAARLRSLNSIYLLNGWAMDLLIGDAAHPQRGLVTVIEAEEGLDGSKIDAELQGFTLRLRRFALPEGVMPKAGDHIALESPFEGHTFFQLAGPSKSWNRSGLQIVISIQPTSDPAIAADPVAEGLPLA